MSASVRYREINGNCAVAKTGAIKQGAREHAAVFPASSVSGGSCRCEAAPGAARRHPMKTLPRESVGGTRLTEQLPHPNTKRWVIRRKAAVLAAMRSGGITVEEACRSTNCRRKSFSPGSVRSKSMASPVCTSRAPRNIVLHEPLMLPNDPAKALLRSVPIFCDSSTGDEPPTGGQGWWAGPLSRNGARAPPVGPPVPLSRRTKAIP